MIDAGDAGAGRGGDWRGQEQAAILLGGLDHKPAAGRLVELLTADRPEVDIAAAWALRTLREPAVLPAVVRHVEAEIGRQVEGRAAAGRDAPVEFVDHQLAQLNILGDQKYARANPVLRRFVPHQPFKVGPEFPGGGHLGAGPASTRGRRTQASWPPWNPGYGARIRSRPRTRASAG